MPYQCKICLIVLKTKKLLKRHDVKKHTKKVRCTLCFLRFPSVKDLNVHYLKKHSKARITKQLISYSSQRPLLPFNWIKTQKISNAIEESFPEKSEKTEKLYIKDNIHISYGNKEIIMELSSDNEESLEVSIDNIATNHLMEENTEPLTAVFCGDNVNCISENVNLDEKLVILPENHKKNKCKRRSSRIRKPPKRYKHFCLEFVKPNNPKSLDHKTGQFYICNCCKSNSSEIKNDNGTINETSDTESSSDNGKYSFSPIIDRKLYCNICGNGYRTETKLIEHQKNHNYYCQTCKLYFATQRQYAEHIRHHIIIYCCHFCHLEFIQKKTLFIHLNFHREQEMLNNVLELENNYSHYLINFNLGSYTTSINNITSFLSQHGDYKMGQSNFFKIRCHLCFLDFFKCDFEQHLKMHYYLKTTGSFYQNSVAYNRI